MLDIASKDGPKFVYAHFILPHPPFVFDKDGSAVSEVEAAVRTKEQNYTNQLIFTNGKILETVDKLFESKAVSPIILIQSDEGPDLWGIENKSRDRQLRWRTEIISAFHLPNVDAGALIPQTVTPVNTFRLVFKLYFGADIDLVEDRVYYWDPATPGGMPDRSKRCRFVDVTPHLERTGVAQ